MLAIPQAGYRERCHAPHPCRYSNTRRLPPDREQARSYNGIATRTAQPAVCRSEPARDPSGLLSREMPCTTSVQAAVYPPAAAGSRAGSLLQQHRCARCHAPHPCRLQRSPLPVGASLLATPQASYRERCHAPHPCRHLCTCRLPPGREQARSYWPRSRRNNR